MQETGQWLLGGAMVVGGVAVGKAAVGHMKLPKEQRRVDPTESSPSRMDDLVALTATLVAGGYMLVLGTELATEWWAKAQQALS